MQDILYIVRSVFSFISIRSQALATPGMDIPPASLPSSLSVSPHFSRPDHFRKRQKPAPDALIRLPSRTLWNLPAHTFDESGPYDSQGRRQPRVVMWYHPPAK